MKLSRTKPSKISFTVECQGQVDGPLDVRLVLGKDKKLSLKTEAFGSDHVVMIPALQEHPWLLEGDYVSASIEIICEKYYFSPMKKNLDVEQEEKFQLEPEISVSALSPQPAAVLDSEKEEPKVAEPLLKVVEASVVVVEAPKKKLLNNNAALQLMETVASTEIKKMKKDRQANDLLQALRNKK